MPVVDTYAKVVVDDSGFISEIPILITEEGVVFPLLDFLLQKQAERSQDWQSRVVRAAKLLIEYMDANQHVFSDPKTLFQTFASRLYTGTVGDDGLDPSGLFWMPTSTTTANRHLSALQGLTDYLADNLDVVHMNPLVTANSHDQRLNYAAWYRRNQNDFLGQIEDKTVSETVGRARLAYLVDGHLQADGHEDETNAPYYFGHSAIQAFEAGAVWQVQRSIQKK